MESQSSFLPNFSGCVEKDRSMARAVERLYREELESVAAYLCRSILSQESDQALSELFDRLAIEEARHFKILGNLLRALGGDLSRCLQARSHYGKGSREEGEERSTQRMIYESLREERRIASLYNDLSAYAEDGVVRSVLSCLMEEERGHGERLTAFLG